MSEHIQNCHVDYIAFSIKPDDTEGFDYFESAVWWIKQIFGPVSVENTGRGWSGFATRLDIPGVGLCAYGGNGGYIHFEITGDGCGRVANWVVLADLLDTCNARLTRIDIAHDDYNGDTLSIDWARAQYNSSGFKPSRGMSPSAHCHSDEGSGKGSTYYVGSRESGKLARIYEKGKQLGDPLSVWVRFEVEWRATHRDLSTDMLRDPTAFFVGAYPCCSFAGSRVETIRTRAFSAAASLEKAVDHACKQAGGVIAALKDLGHSAEEILARIAKPEVSKRLLPNVAALKLAISGEVTFKPPSWWRPPTKEEADRTEAALRLDFSYWRNKWKDLLPENRDPADLAFSRKQTAQYWGASYQG